MFNHSKWVIPDTPGVFDTIVAQPNVVPRRGMVDILTILNQQYTNDIEVLNDYEIGGCKLNTHRYISGKILLINSEVISYRFAVMKTPKTYSRN